MPKRSVLILEDDPGVSASLKRLLDRYADEIDVESAEEPRSALESLTSKTLDALILDVTMPYGDASEDLTGKTDPTGYETGKRVLSYCREWERKNGAQSLLWVAVITVRSNPRFLDQVKQLLAGRGAIYTKPFDDLVLENDLALVLRLESKVPPGLLPDDYTPPDLTDGASK